jgi:3-oxoadipate enol-lactonase/4-carboxymuconolactone decarboxylase
MPIVTLGEYDCYYRLEGREDGPVLMLAHSLGADHGMWDPQAADLARRFRVLRYDIRGHGASAVTPGDYTIEQLGRDGLALLDRLRIDQVAFCGLSLGGMIALWLAAHAAHRLTAVVLANTSPAPGAERMEARRQAVLANGMSAIADAAMGRFFTARTLARNPPPVATARHTLLSTDPVGYAGCCAAIRDFNMVSSLGTIHGPALVISGEYDESLPWNGHGDRLATIAGATVAHLPTAHLSNIEAPRSFTAALDRFLSPSSDRSDDGLRQRRAVLGEDHVDRAIAEAVSPDFQRFITQYVWGGVWSRPALDVRTRRLLTLALTASLGRWDEFALHVRTGLSRELEWCDVEEVLLHTAVYAGVPAANSALRIAAEQATDDADGTDRTDDSNAPRVD